MKKSDRSKSLLPAVLALSIVVTGVLAFAGERNYPTAPATFTVGTNSVMIAAPRMVTAKSWVAATAYAQGDMVRSTAHTDRVYWNVTTNAAAAVTCPDHISVMTDVTDGNITWRRIVPRERMGIFITAEAGNVWLSIGSAAVATRGITLLEGAMLQEDSKLQGAVYAISTGDVTVLTQEL